jgi:prevent-host-death family protein
MIVNVSDAKANLSKLIDQAYHGERVVIAKNNLPVADLVAHKQPGKRRLGLLKGKGSVPQNFCDENMTIEDMFYGSDS